MGPNFETLPPPQPFIRGRQPVEATRWSPMECERGAFVNIEVDIA
jgi:hypothetical protein